MARLNGRTASVAGDINSPLIRLVESVGFVDVAVTPTHAVADGLHGAIIRATKPAGWTPESIRPVSLPAPLPGLPVAAGSACCGGAGCC